MGASLLGLHSKILVTVDDAVSPVEIHDQSALQDPQYDSETDPYAIAQRIGLSAYRTLVAPSRVPLALILQIIERTILEQAIRDEPTASGIQNMLSLPHETFYRKVRRYNLPFLKKTYKNRDS